MVTAETALVLPVVILLLAVCLTVLRYGIDEVRCLDAARAGARAAARGDTSAAVVEVARRGAPEGADVAVATAGRLVTVRVTAPSRVAAGIVAGLPAPEGAAVAELEGGDDGP